MRQLFVMLILGSYLCSTTELHELFKLPALYGHFHEHAKLDSGETFLCFLADHYLYGEHHDDSEEHGHGLPFHYHHDCASHALQVASPVSAGALVFSVPSSPAEAHALDGASYSFLVSRDVWQPPKA